MELIDVTMVRVYLSNGHGDVNKLISWFIDDAKVQGCNLFNAIEGLNKHGCVHNALSGGLLIELPLVIEFFDTPERVTEILEQLPNLVTADHVVTWTAKSGS